MTHLLIKVSWSYVWIFLAMEELNANAKYRIVTTITSLLVHTTLLWRIPALIPVIEAKIIVVISPATILLIVNLHEEILCNCYTNYT